MEIERMGKYRPFDISWNVYEGECKNCGKGELTLVEIPSNFGISITLFDILCLECGTSYTEDIGKKKFYGYLIPYSRKEILQVIYCEKYDSRF